MFKKVVIQLYNNMAQKIISVSLSQGDKDFMRDKFLSPSKLLQERITQIRDEENPALREMIKDANNKILNLTGKLSHSTRMLSKICDAAQTKIPEEEWSAMIEKI